MARAIRAHCLASGQSAAQIALIIHSQCSPPFGTTLVRAHRLALGIALADVVAQVRARYVSEGRTPPRFSETLLSSYEGGQKRPGPEYLHYLCCVYQAEPADLGYEGPCLCGQGHRAPVLMLSGPVHAAPPEPGRPGGPGLHGHDLPDAAPSAPPILTAVPGGGEPGPAEPGGRTAGGPVGLTATQLPALEARPRPADRGIARPGRRARAALARPRRLSAACPGSAARPGSPARLSAARPGSGPRLSGAARSRSGDTAPARTGRARSRAGRRGRRARRRPRRAEHGGDG